MVLPSLPLAVTMLYAVPLALLFVVLTFNVMRHRVRVTIDSESVDGDTVERVSRVHGNFAEYVPLALVLLAVLEMNGAPREMLHGLGILLVVSRVLHAWGMTRRPLVSFGRIVGIQGTLMMLLASAVTAVWLLVQV